MFNRNCIFTYLYEIYQKVTHLWHVRTNARSEVTTAPDLTQMNVGKKFQQTVLSNCLIQQTRQIINTSQFSATFPCSVLTQLQS